MNMNDIREGYGAEFIDYLTNEFAKPLDDRSDLFTKNDFLDELRKVRENNYEPLYLEMIFALHNVFISGFRKGLGLYQSAIEITEVELEIYEKHVDIQDGMIKYLERQPTENAKKAKEAQDSKLDPVREYAWKLANEKPYPSRRQAVLSIKEAVLAYAKSIEGVRLSPTQAQTTIDGWLAKRGFAPTPPAGKRGTAARKDSPSSA
ncbi:hypothetical protein PQR21_14985 [Paraburkholderia nemoris]|uniref:hypothetical protein n=1 Tax=Paraburkholderia nemoris TaxID=2793076 RepID=UPI0038B6CD37